MRFTPLLRLAGACLVASTFTATSALSDTFTLRIGSGHPNGPAVYVTDMATFFVPEVKRRVAEETDHEINFVEGYGGAIATVAETLEAVQNGLLDIGGYCMCFEPAKLFLHNFPYYAPFGPQESSQQLEAARLTYEKIPWLREQFTEQYGQKLLALHGWDNYHLGTTMEWETIEDLKGVKIGGPGPNLPWLEYVGAIPVQSSLPEGYLSLSTGVYDGWLMFPSAYLSFKFYEPAPHYTLVGFGAVGVTVLTMNERSYNRLPPEVQKIIDEVGTEFEKRAGQRLDEQHLKGLEGLKANGTNIKALDEEIRVEWAKFLADFPRKQAQEGDSRGMPGTEVMKAYLEAVEEVGYEWPHKYSID